jgi:aspartyl-tRNA(Asn)/glutamyl-tRNA(Gln) amidotransferase subunit C
MSITKKDIEHLARLSKIALSENESESLVKDIEKILDHFEDIGGVDVNGIDPVTGGTLSKNITRDDNISPASDDEKKRLLNSFPKQEGNCLVVPSVFD